MLTPAGTSFSARSANPSGAGRAAQEVAAGNASTNAAAAATDERRNRNLSIDTLFDSSQQKPEIARIKIGLDNRRHFVPGGWSNHRPGTPPRQITGDAAGKPDPFAAARFSG